MPDPNKIETKHLSIDWKIGVEVELLAPKGMSRFDLATAIAREYEGEVRRFFHPQVEPSKVSGTPLFNNLTLGFEVLDKTGNTIAYCVDDLTLQDDFDKSHPPREGWYRVVSDESRLLQLLLQQCNPVNPLNSVLEPIATLFGTELEIGQGNMFRVADSTGASIAIAAPLPGERERPCELIIPPIDNDHYQKIESLLHIARSLDFTAPTEGATHIHFDANALESTTTLANLMRFLWKYDENLVELLKTNPNCRRLGKWSKELYYWMQDPEFIALPWEHALHSLAEFEITKYCNFNLKNLLLQKQDKYTFEVRILPVYQHAQEILAAAGLFEGILNWAIQTPLTSELPNNFDEIVEKLPLSTEIHNIWNN
ncbi:MAG: amidoligase family protein [Spirochaetota bacterium]